MEETIEIERAVEQLADAITKSLISRIKGQVATRIGALAEEFQSSIDAGVFDNLAIQVAEFNDAKKEILPPHEPTADIGAEVTPVSDELTVSEVGESTVEVVVEASLQEEVAGDQDLPSLNKSSDVIVSADGTPGKPRRRHTIIEEIFGEPPFDPELLDQLLDKGYGPEDVMEHIKSLLGPGHASEQLIEGALVFKEAIRLERKMRKDEERQQRAEEANKARVKRMEERRQKRDAEMRENRESALRKKQEEEARRSAEPPAPKEIEIQPITPLARKRVVVVGLLPYQQKIIKDEYGKAFEFVFYEQRTRLGNIRGVAAASDQVITMVNFIAHSHEDALGDVEHLERIKGGMSSLKTFLNNFYLNSYINKEAQA